jgi:hypothetical protein
LTADLLITTCQAIHARIYVVHMRRRRSVRLRYIHKNRNANQMIDISQNVDYDRAIVGAAPPLGWRRRRVGMAARWEVIEESALRHFLDRVPGVGKSETRTVRNETVVKSLKTINSAKLVIRRP